MGTRGTQTVERRPHVLERNEWRTQDALAAVVMSKVTKPTNFVTAALLEFKSEAILFSVVVMHFSASRAFASQCLQLNHPTVPSAEWTMASSSTKAERNASTHTARVTLPLLLSEFEISDYLRRLFSWRSTCRCTVCCIFPPTFFNQWSSKCDWVKN